MPDQHVAERPEPLAEIFERPAYPVTGLPALFDALPDDPNAAVDTGDRTLRTVELRRQLYRIAEFPYADAEEVAADVRAGLGSCGRIHWIQLDAENKR